jgi:hypothetical protein
MNAAECYLRLPGAYCDFLGGLRWSAEDDVLEFRDGTHFAFTEQVALLLEGFASGGRLVHIGFILHLLDALSHADSSRGKLGKYLGAAFADTGRQLRNAGAFCAFLCQGIPEVVGEVEVRQVLECLRDPARRLRRDSTPAHDVFYLSELPPLDPGVFENEILARLNTVTLEELHFWMRHGRGPLGKAGKELAQVLPPPRTLAGALAALLERPRLAGARPFVTQLVSALALPPRRRSQPEMPLGGYADVTTSGQPHRLLLSQFALDELDFLRRFADHELLYFRREEPHSHTRHELVVLLDQGVRTWGDVRLVLGAAVLALGRQAEKGRLPFRVATTSGEGELLDPVAADDETLGRSVEASDLSANPGLALERVLEQPKDGSRDVVLLTHPRNLQEDDVRAAALGADRETRLLALALDGHGQAGLSELRHGVPVPLRQFRVDFTAAATPPAPPEEFPAPWRGDIEPIGFPFRFGTDGQIAPWRFGFDYEGRWLLTATRGGLLHAWKLDGSGAMEMLPRPLVWGRPPDSVDGVLGVAGGFVVVARNQKEPTHGKATIALVHYDLGKRTCRKQEVQVPSALPWRYSPQHHVVVTTPEKLAFDLVSGVLVGATDSAPTSQFARLEQAWELAARGKLPPRWLLCRNRPYPGVAEEQACNLNRDRGELHLQGIVPAWNPFVPLSDGKPVLKKATVVAARCQGDVLAVHCLAQGGWGVRLFRGPDGIPLAEFPDIGLHTPFDLSTDGRLLARQISTNRVEVRETGGNPVPVAATYAGRFSERVLFILAADCLEVRAARWHRHLLSWKNCVLEVQHHKWNSQERKSREADIGTGITGALGTPDGVPQWLHYDRERFISGATMTVTAVLDRHGQIAVLDGRRLVCMFFAFRDGLSGWLPDGTAFGPASQGARKATPDILAKFGRALTVATWRGDECP